MSIAGQIVENQIETPHSPMGSAKLPCGWIERPAGGDPKRHTETIVREYSGHQEFLMNSERIPPYLKTSAIIASVLQKIGPHEDRQIIEALPAELLIGDRLAILKECRVLAFGKVYPYTYPCPNQNCKFHKKPDLHLVDLDDLELKEMPEPDKRVYETRIRGITYRWHPMNGADQERVDQTDANKLDQMLLGRVDAVDGVRPTLLQVRGWGGLIRDTLRASFEEAEGGFDTEVEMECKNCGRSFSTDVDIAQPGFFFPQQTLSRWRKKSSSSPSSGTSTPT